MYMSIPRLSTTQCNVYYSLNTVAKIIHTMYWTLISEDKFVQHTKSHFYISVQRTQDMDLFEGRAHC